MFSLEFVAVEPHAQSIVVPDFELNASLLVYSGPHYFEVALYFQCIVLASHVLVVQIIGLSQPFAGFVVSILHKLDIFRDRNQRLFIQYLLNLRLGLFIDLRDWLNLFSLLTFSFCG